jgi:hypothetical protein
MNLTGMTISCVSNKGSKGSSNGSRALQCPTWGYPTEGAYYRDATSTDSMLAIRIPFLSIQAEDDPVSYDRLEFVDSPLIRLDCLPGGFALPGNDTDTLWSYVDHLVGWSSGLVRVGRSQVVCQAGTYPAFYHRHSQSQLDLVLTYLLGDKLFEHNGQGHRHYHSRCGRTPRETTWNHCQPRRPQQRPRHGTQARLQRNATQTRPTPRALNGGHQLLLCSNRRHPMVYNRKTQHNRRHCIMMFLFR